MDVLQTVQRRCALQRALRAFFEQRGFVEAETPLLIPANAPEDHIDALSLEAQIGAEQHQLYLRSSPELALKRLLAAGGRRVFELARVARDGEHDHDHRVEFTLLEWYRADCGYETLMSDCDELLAHCCQVLGIGPVVPGVHGPCDLARGCERLSVAEAFEQHAGIALLPMLPGDGAGLAAAAHRSGVALPPSLAHDPAPDFEELFFAVFLTAVEPKLGLARPTLLYEWPASMAALARRHPERPELALRFELYAGGLELANAFDELTDPVEQRQRFERSAAARRAAGRAPYPSPEAFLSDLGQMPPSAGIALGFERLLMLLHGDREIDPAGLPWGF